MKKRLHHYKQVWKAFETKRAEWILRFLLPIIVAGIGMALEWQELHSGKQLMQISTLLLIWGLGETGFDFARAKYAIERRLKENPSD